MTTRDFNFYEQNKLILLYGKINEFPYSQALLFYKYDI